MNHSQKNSGNSGNHGYKTCRACLRSGSVGAIFQQECELHHFSDTSAVSYGECTYLRAVNANGDVPCSVVMGKACHTNQSNHYTTSRIICGNGNGEDKDLLRNRLEFDDLQEHFWTDSKVVLGYINNDARRFHVFVANRIQRIKSTTEPKQWQFVHSDDNPADHVSGGLMQGIHGVLKSINR